MTRQNYQVDMDVSVSKDDDSSVSGVRRSIQAFFENQDVIRIERIEVQNDDNR